MRERRLLARIAVTRSFRLPAISPTAFFPCTTGHMSQSDENSPRPRSEEHMLGHGFYNKHSHEQAKANTYGLPLLIEAINHIDLQQVGGEFRIADYGSAQGQNSLLPMKTAIKQLKELIARSGKREIAITVTDTDLATNDWTTLFQTVLSSPDSY